MAAAAAVRVLLIRSSKAAVSFELFWSSSSWLWRHAAAGMATSTSGLPFSHRELLERAASNHSAAAAQGTVSPASSSPSSTDEDEALAAPSRARMDGTIQRIYKHVDIQPLGDGFTVTLDGRALQTPRKRPLCVPTRALALAVAAEWEWQSATHVRPFTMPLMKLATTAIDQVAPDVENVISQVVEYADDDAICCRAESGPLAERQKELWDPLVQWSREDLGVELAVSDSIFGVRQPKAALDSIAQMLRPMTSWEISAIESLAGAARSVVIALAVVKGRLSMDEALQVIRCEEDYQTKEWGFVEGGHDVDIADLRVRIVAPCVYLQLLRH
eukprot:jgi/Chlat1/8207/Chrsp76S07642